MKAFLCKLMQNISSLGIETLTTISNPNKRTSKGFDKMLKLSPTMVLILSEE